MPSPSLEPQGPEGLNVGLRHLPHHLLHAILFQICGDGTGGVGSVRDAVALAFSCHSLQQAVASADQLWQQQCTRLGWSLEFLAALPAGAPHPAWRYFCLRMAARHRVRARLRAVRAWLDARSAAALRPPTPPSALLAAEAKLGSPLPWGLFELLRWCDGQEGEQGAHFLDAARLLSTAEVVAAARERHDRTDAARAFQLHLAQQQQQTQQREQPRGTGASAACSGPAAHNAAGRALGGMPPPPPEVLLPFSSELRGRKQYCMALDGTVWLASGFNVLPAAPCLAELLRRMLA